MHAHYHVPKPIIVILFIVMTIRLSLSNIIYPPIIVNLFYGMTFGRFMENNLIYLPIIAILFFGMAFGLPWNNFIYLFVYQVLDWTDWLVEVPSI